MDSLDLRLDACAVAPLALRGLGHIEGQRRCSLAVEHSLSKRKVTSSILVVGFTSHLGVCDYEVAPYSVSYNLHFAQSSSGAYSLELA